MALMIDKRPKKYEGEQKVYDALEKNLKNNIICYYNREINGHEFDFCLFLSLNQSISYNKSFRPITPTNLYICMYLFIYSVIIYRQI